MAQQPPPSGYLNRKIAQSAEEALAKYSIDHIKTIVKATVQKYISSFFNTDGGNREVFKAVSKLGLQYITDQSFSGSSDPTLRKTQLARLFENVRHELPAILIMDTSFDYVHQNWTGLDRVWRNANEWYANMFISRNLGVQIAVGTRDQSTCDMLHGLLSVLFGELQFTAGGQRITGNYNMGETWVVKIGKPALGTVSKQNVKDDPKDLIWTFGIELENVLFEDSVTYKQPLPRYGPPGQGVLNEPELGWTPPIIYMQEEIPINESADVLFDLIQPGVHRIIITDPNIATYEPQSHRVYPRRLGTTKIQVLRTRRDKDGSDDQQTGSKDVVVASFEFKVTST